MSAAHRALLTLLIVNVLVVVFVSPTATAAPSIRYGVQDDAWLQYGPGTLDERVATLRKLGVRLVRYTLTWSAIEPRRGLYRWEQPDVILNRLHRGGIDLVLTLWGTPRWANGGRSANWAPMSKRTFAAFAGEAARRYPFVRRWVIWNEPNKRLFLRPTSARVYVRTLLNPAYNAIHSQISSAAVAGGATGPTAGPGGISPVGFIKLLAHFHARLDAYAHNPYPRRPQVETPSTGACGHCSTITMASLPRLVYWVKRELGSARIWLTEYGYQTNPPDHYLGISPSRQAQYLGAAAFRAYEASRVDLLIHYIVRDDRALGGWQSGLLAADGTPKPAFWAYMLPLAQVSRQGRATIIWGQIRPRTGPQPYRLERLVAGRWVAVGGSAGVVHAAC